MVNIVYNLSYQSPLCLRQKGATIYLYYFGCGYAAPWFTFFYRVATAPRFCLRLILTTKARSGSAGITVSISRPVWLAKTIRSDTPSPLCLRQKGATTYLHRHPRCNRQRIIHQRNGKNQLGRVLQAARCGEYFYWHINRVFNY